MPTLSAKTATAREPADPLATAESLGRQLRGLLPPLRLHSVSVYDQTGDVLWLSEGALGPDEHGFVVEALGKLGGEPVRAHCLSDFNDGRGAIFLAVRSPQAELVGLVMLLVDAKILSGSDLAGRILTPPARSILQRLAILLRPNSAAAPPPPAASAPPVAAAAAARAAPATPPARAATAPVAPAARPVPAMKARAAAAPPRRAPPLKPAAPPPAAAKAPAREQAVPARELVTLEWTVPESGTTTSSMSLSTSAITTGARTASTTSSLSVDISSTELTIEALAPKEVDAMLTIAATPAAPAELQVQELSKLRPGGGTRRFHLMAAGDGSVSAFTTQLRALTTWLRHHKEVRERTPMSFAIGVAESALADEKLADLMTGCVRAGGVRPDCIGFVISESACVAHPQYAEHFVSACAKLGSFIVLDDFAFDSGALELLRSKALRMVKVDARLTAAALRDKLAQARVVAISQAAKVLGVHCAAKQVDNQTARRWFTAAGFDFAEGSLFSSPVAIESLATPAPEAT
ncbi:MAG TPA: EAL domain-containing protein [Steroidobacteraceae bacterium]|nr:EAL domain-containing protein [Steroidobacteraceae bacterium]